PAPPSPTSPLSLHDALPIYRPATGRTSRRSRSFETRVVQGVVSRAERVADSAFAFAHGGGTGDVTGGGEDSGRLEVALGVVGVRSEEHTSELQSLAYLLCRL